jgi:hypothetical protein
MEKILTLRSDIPETIQNMETLKKSPTNLELVNIIGRKAFTRHSNLFYDFDERLVYVSGCNLVIHTVQEQDNARRRT